MEPITRPGPFATLQVLLAPFSGCSCSETLATAIWSQARRPVAINLRREVFCNEVETQRPLLLPSQFSRG